MKKIFITGGAGYVGSVLTPYLISKGHKITVFYLMLYGDTLKKDKNPFQKSINSLKAYQV